jgi:predicted enzyme related to lactoylglutathione lyase
MMSRVVGFEVMGQDADKLRRFYGDLLGWQFASAPTPRGAGGGGKIQAEPSTSGLAGRIGQSGPGHPNWLLLYNEVPNLEAAVACALGLGSRVLMPPVRLADKTIAVVSDPEGHPVGLCSAA